MKTRVPCLLFLVLGTIVSTVTADEPQLTSEQLFDASKLLDVEINLAEKDWNSIRKQTRTIVEALGKTHPERPFEYVKGDVKISGVLIQDVGIRKKGFIGSLSDDRPSLKIKFTEYKKQNPVSGLDRLTLNNNNQDPSRMMQYLSYKLFNESGTIASRCNLAKVTVNGEYLGIYSNVESIKETFLEQRFGDGSGALYEGTIADFYPDTIKKFEFKNKSAKLEYLQAVAEAFDGDQVDLDTVRKLIDIEAFVKFWAMESLMGFWDGYNSNQNNFFIYRNPSNSKMYFLPWGLDSTFSKSTPLPPYRIKIKSVHCQSVIANQLFRNPEIQDLYRKTMEGFLEKHWLESELNADIDRVEAMLKDELGESNTGFAKATDKIRDFIDTRRKAIDRELEKWPVELTARSRRPVYFKEIGVATATFSTNWYDTSPKKGEEVGTIDIEMTYEGETVEFESVGSFAEVSKWPSREKIKPPTVVVVGIRKSDGKKLTMGVSMDITRFKAGEKSVEVQGIMIDGENFGRGGFKMIGGTVSLDEAAMEEGAAVSGQLKLRIVQMVGGEPRKED